MDAMQFATAEIETTTSRLRERHEIPEERRWNLADIFSDWDEWRVALGDLDARIDRYAALQGTLASGSEALLAAFQLSDEIGQWAYKVWYYASLNHDQDQRDNTVNAKRQDVQILLAKSAQAGAWFNPELLAIPIETVRRWIDGSPALGVYRFAIEDVYRQQEHVLDEKGEHLLSLASRFDSAPGDAYSALSTADVRYPAITLSTGASIVLTYGNYRALLATNRNQPDRATAFRTFHELYAANANTYASLYDGVLQRDWFHARARGYRSTLAAALHGDNIPESVVENLIETTKAGAEPLRRYHRLRRRALRLESYHTYDGLIPLVDFDRTYRYEEVLDWIVESVVPLGTGYVERMRTAFAARWIDVYENAGKRSGAYSAPVYGVHPYMLLNYNDTLDAVFTLAHEMGHSMHTLLSHAHQPFVYASYTIFVAEVPSTLSEALFLDYMLSRTSDRQERIVLLQHAIDDMVGTFYTQVLFADFELQAHRLVEAGKPITSDVLGDLYFGLLRAYHGAALDYDDIARVTWARIPHFYSTPYYVYQYATCYASSARLIQGITDPGEGARTAVDRYLRLLESGGSDYPMTLLERAGVDLGQPDTVQSVGELLDRRVSQLETEIERLGQS